MEVRINQCSRGYHKRRVLSLLSDGNRYSAADISIKLGLSDPRSVIRCLRNDGVMIADEWVKAVHGGKFKRYYIQKGGAQ